MRRQLAEAVHAIARTVGWLSEVLPAPLDRWLRRTWRLAERSVGFPAPVAMMPPCSTPLVSIVVPARNNWRYTRSCIESLVAAEPGLKFEVILGDDASTDETRKAERHVPGLVVCRQKSNVGFLRNCNAAARLARGRYLVLLNNDTQVQPGALSQMLRVFSVRPDAGLVGAKLVYPDGTLQEAGGIVWQDGSASNHGWGSDPNLPEFSYLKEADYCSGACIMVLRELWEQLGGFDERFSPAYYEDTDLAFRVREAGRAVYLQPAATVVHIEGRSHGVDVGSGVKAKQVENQSVFRAKWKDVLDRDQPRRGVDVFHARDRSVNRPCILIVDHYVPQPDRDAGSRSMWCIIRVLLDMGLGVKFWPHNRCRDPAYAPKLEEMGVEVLCGTGSAGVFSEWMSRHGNDVDAVLLSRPHVAADCIDDIRRFSSARTIYYGHDLHHERMRAQAEVTGDARLRADADSMRSLEESLWRRADLVYYPSFLETAEVARSCPEAVARTLPAYFFETPRQLPSGPQGRHGIIFVAGFAHQPNVDAAQWLVHEIMPLVRRQMPGVQLWLAGSNPTVEVMALASADVSVTGNLSDEALDALYRQSRVAVVPLRFGAGVKHKVLEAMHHGVPLVTTSVGMQGLPELDRVVPVVEGVGALADAIVELLADDTHWASTARRGSEYVQHRYSREAMRTVIAQDFSTRVSRPAPNPEPCQAPHPATQPPAPQPPTPQPPTPAGPVHDPIRNAEGRRWMMPLAATLLLCVVQALVLLRHIDRPGLYYDEILFVNAAVGGLGDDFITLRIGSLPVMLMPYIGALKAWILSPILAVGDICPATVRVPAIAIGLAGSALACMAMCVWFGRIAAVATAFAVCFDPTVGMQSRLDWGPNAIMFLCRGGFLLGIALACTRRTRSGLLCMFACTAAGCFDKLSFLWIAIPGFAAFALIERELLADLVRRHRTAMVAWGVGVVALLMAAITMAMWAPLEPRAVTLAERANEAARLLWQCLAGDGALDFILGSGAGGHSGQAALATGSLVVAAAIGVPAALKEERRWRRSWALLLGFCVLVVTTFAATRVATGPHHAAVIAGLWQLPLIPSIAAGIARARVSRRWIVASLQCGLVALASATCLSMTWQRVDAVLEIPVNPNWDQANWECGKYLSDSLEEPVVFTDWGMGNHAIAATRGRSGRIRDAWPSFRTDADARAAIEMAGPATIFCVRMPGFETMVGNRDRFMQAAASLGLAPVRVRAFAAETGADMIEFVRLEPVAP